MLKGPQGALYGRNAIGGAIIVRTADPPDHFEGTVRAGVGNGVSEKGMLALGGPIDSGGTLRYRASFNYYNTDGYLENSSLGKKADPYKDYTGRVRLLWRPTEQLSADLRVFLDHVETTAYYYIIPRDDEANPFSSFTTPPNANDVTSPIQTNNLGTDNRDVTDVALKLDYGVGLGTFTAVSDYNQTKEIDTGDAYDFRPIITSITYNCPFCFGAAPTPAQGGPFDLSQSQFIDVKTYSQELRFTSNKVNNFSWIAGAYFVHTERFISTDNIIDRGFGVPRVYETPIVDPTNPYATNTNFTFLADSQNNNAWAVFADATYEFTKQWEFDAAIRYDEDQRQNTTDTPTAFLPAATLGTAATGEVRKETFSAVQPKGTLRYKPTENVTIYGGWSRGFRSGGFNQTGVGAVAAAAGHLGVHDVFQARDRRHLGSRFQERVPRPATGREPGPVRHHFAQWLLLLLRRHDLDAEPRQSRCALQGRGARADRQSDGLARPVRKLWLHGRQDHRDAGSHGGGQQAAAADPRHGQRRLPGTPPARRQPQGRGAPGLSDDRPYLVGPV